MKIAMSLLERALSGFGVPPAGGRAAARPMARGDQAEINVGHTERVVSTLAGSAMLRFALGRHRRGSGLMTLTGLALVYRGLRGVCPLYQALGYSSAAEGAGASTATPVARGAERALGRAAPREDDEDLLRPSVEENLGRLEIGFPVFLEEGGEDFGSIRGLEGGDGRPQVVIYIENSGDFLVPAEAIRSVHDGKVILDPRWLSRPIRDAIARAHEAEVPGL